MRTPRLSNLPRCVYWNTVYMERAIAHLRSTGGGLTVLKALLTSFLRRADGMCCPSVKAIQEKTGLARSTIFEALNRLEAAGIITRVRRLVDFGGLSRLTTVQTSNLYAFFEPRPGAHLLPIKRRIRNDAARLVAKLAKAFAFQAESAERPGNHQLVFSKRGFTASVASQTA
jgi:DNA-binding Lrp family transcriptional regulator